MDDEFFNGDDLYKLENATHLGCSDDLKKSTIHFEMLVGKKRNLITQEEELVTVFGSIVQASFDKKNLGRTIPMAATNFHTARIPQESEIDCFHKMGNDEKTPIQVNMKVMPLNYSAMNALETVQFQRVIETAIGQYLSIRPMDKKRHARVEKRVATLSQPWSRYKIRSATAPQKKAAYMYEMYRTGKLEDFVPLALAEASPVSTVARDVEVGREVQEPEQAILIHTGDCIAVRLDRLAQTPTPTASSASGMLPTRAYAVNPSSRRQVQNQSGASSLPVAPTGRRL